ncbi:MAG: hypothetical protein ABSA91_17260 [Acidimicrobiales bacterium]|jgi:hypothetical protein
MTRSPETTQTYRELAAIARTAVSLIEQIAPDRLDAYVGTSTIVASVLSEFGVAATAVSGYFGTEPHSWLEADGFRIDLARALLDGGPLVQSLTVQSEYLAQARFPACWLPEEAVAQFASVFDYPVISARRGWSIFEYLRQSSFDALRVA